MLNIVEYKSLTLPHQTVGVLDCLSPITVFIGDERFYKFNSKQVLIVVNADCDDEEVNPLE